MNNNNKKKTQMRKKNTQKKKDYETKDRLENRPFYKLFTRIFIKKKKIVAL